MSNEIFVHPSPELRNRFVEREKFRVLGRSAVLRTLVPALGWKEDEVILDNDRSVEVEPHAGVIRLLLTLGGFEEKQDGFRARLRFQVVRGERTLCVRFGKHLAELPANLPRAVDDDLGEVIAALAAEIQRQIDEW